MAWEPDTEEIRLSENKKSVESLRADQNIMNTSINNNDSSTNMGSLNGQPSFSTGQDGDVVQEVFNDISDVVINSVTYVVGAFETLGSYFTVKPSATNEPTPNCATVKYLKGAVNGQKITLKPQSTKALCLKHNPTSNSSTIGNLYIGSDITLTDSEVITLRFTTELLYTDYKGAWIVESTGSGSGNSTSGVLKDPVKVASTGNNSLHPAWGSTIDGIGMVAGDRFLVKDQSNPNEKDNGIYIWGTGTLGVSVRSSDMSDGSVQKEGTMTYVQDGLTQNERLYAINIGGNHITIGSSNNTWGEIGSGSGGGSGAIKSPVKVATTADVTSWTYNNTSGTLTASGNGVVVIDGITLAVNNRILVKDQSPANENGIYSVTTAGAVGATLVLTRSTDMSTGSTIEGGTMVYVTDGTINGDNLFGLTTEGTVTVGTGNQAWANLTAGGANTALSNLALTTSINSDLTMQNGLSIANLERVAFNTRTSSGIAGSISYNGTDIFAKGSGAEVNLTAGGFAVLSASNTFTGAVNTFSNATGTFQANTPTINLGTTTGNTNIIGNINIGSSTSNSITFNGLMNSNIIPGLGTLTLGSSGNQWMDLWIDGTAHIDVLDVDETLNVDGQTTLNGGVDLGNGTSDAISVLGLFDTNLIAGAGNLTLGSSANQWMDLWLDGTAHIDVLDVDETSNFDGNAVFNEDVILGSSIIDLITFNGAISSNLIPSGTYTLGSSGSQWTDLWIDGTAHIDILDVDETSNFDGNAVFNEDVTLGSSDIDRVTFNSLISSNLIPSGIYTLGSSGNQWTDLWLDGTAHIDILDVDETLNVDGQTTLNGGVDLGNGTLDAISVLGLFDTNLIPGLGTLTLGSSGNQWADLWIDGTAHIDSLEFGGTSMTVPNNTGTVGQVLTSNGSNSMSWTTVSGGASGANLTLSNLSSPVAINQTLLPNVAGGVIYSLGSSSAKWRSVFTERLGFGTTAMTMPTNSGNNGEVLTTNGSSTLSWTAVSGGSQTPWTSQISAGNNALVNANSIQFSNQNQTAVSSTIPYIQFDNYDFIMNAPSDRAIELKIGGQGFISLVGNASADRVIQIQRRIDMGGNYIQFDGMTAPSTVSNEPLLFANSGNSSHLSIRTGSGSIIDLEASSSSGADTDLNNLTTTSVNQNLIPETDGGQNLGSSSKYWNYLYASTRIKLQGRMDFNGDNNYTYIDQNQYGLDFQTPSGSTWDFYVDSDKILEIDDEGLMVHHTSTSSSGRSCIRANNSSYEIGFHTTASTSVGSEGAMGAPYNAMSGRETSSSNLNNRYGSADGCIGIQHDTSSGYAYLYAKTNGAWKYSILAPI